MAYGLTSNRTLSMTFGRPAAIPDNYIKLELPIDIDAAVAPAMPASLCQSASVQFFNATMYVQLYSLRRALE